MSSWNKRTIRHTDEGRIGFLSAILDLLRGLFPLSTTLAPENCDYRTVLEERYSKPRRCC